MRVLVAMPRYTTQAAMPAAQAFYHPSRPDSAHKVRAVSPMTSLLTACFNSCWALARNEWEAGEADAFAMIHSDVGAEIFWLDTLIAEMEATGVDVMGVAIPIKDARGLTSTAVDDTGDQWRVRRLTTRELFKLPPTFTDSDVPGLLLNTGLWVCRLGPWCLETMFHVQDCIIRQPDGRWAAGTMPEDWGFSRQCRKLGLRLGVTRKVTVEHYGENKWSNQEFWGWRMDFQNANRDGAWRWPQDVEGFLSEAEGQELASLAHGKDVLEIGSFHGLSTICMAQTARHVDAVDPFDARDCLKLPRDTYADFLANIVRYGVNERISVHRGTSADILPRMIHGGYDLAFIDGAHDDASVWRDALLARPLLRPGGKLAFHDYLSARDPGVTTAVDRLIATGARLDRVTDTIAVLEWPTKA